MKRILLIISIFTCSSIYSQSNETNIDYFAYFELYQVEDIYRNEILIDSLRVRFDITKNFKFILNDTTGYLLEIEIQSSNAPNIWYTFTGVGIEEKLQHNRLHQFYNL